MCAFPDLDGDGFVELLVGCPWYEDDVRGGAWVFSGKSGALLIAVQADEDCSLVGSSVAYAGDLDGDGRPDFTAASWDGFLRAYSGRDGAMLWSVKDEAYAGQFGPRMAPVEDLNADGLPDLAVGFGRSGLLREEFGELRMISGADGAILKSLPAERFQSSFARSVEGLGGLDSLGLRDFVTGHETETGYRVQVRSGHDGSTLRTMDVPWKSNAKFAGHPPLQAVEDVDGGGRRDLLLLGGEGRLVLLSYETGKVLWQTQDGELCAFTIGDVSGDGTPDVAVSWAFGVLLARSGADGSALYSLVTSKSEYASWGMPMAMVGLGDLDGDGRGDFAYSFTQPGSPGLAGHVIVASGKDGSTIREHTLATTLAQRAAKEPEGR